LTINYDDLSKQVLDLDPQVRFAGVANIKGVMVAGGQKDNIEKILTDHEISMSLHYAFQKRELYTTLAYKIGDEDSSITEFKKVTMITIPINSQELFLLSTEPRADYIRIIDYVHSILDSQKDTE
jgi:hypothetical protein